MVPSADSSKRKRVGLIVLSAVLVLLAGAITWNVLSSGDDNVKPKTRQATDFLVTWRCLACEHEAEDFAGPGPRVCPTCGKEQFYASIRFVCPKHGEFRVAFNYDERGKPSMVKVGDDGTWAPYIDLENMRTGLVCPVCGGSMMPAESPRLPEDNSTPLPTEPLQPAE